MSQSEPPSTYNRASEITTPSPLQVRTSKQRAEEIKQYILGLLPAHISKSVDVVITPQVPTAAVLPATEDALITDEQTEFDRAQARQLIEAVDGDYLVLITSRETPDAGPLNDELSADRAHQFGLAFHETLHILKTAFKGIQTLLRTEVEEQYRDFVHDLINATEDGAIEHEVYVGDDFSRRAGNRLRLVREIHKRKPEDYEALPTEKSKFTFRDALQKGLHDNVILPSSGTTRALLDEDDDRVTFASDAERTAFLQIYPEIEQLAEEIHAIRGDVGTELHRNDATASIRRAKRTIKFWHEIVKPFVNTDAREEQQGQQNGQQSSPGGDAGQQQSSQPQPGDDASTESNDRDPSSTSGAGDSTQEDGTPEDAQGNGPEESAVQSGSPSTDIDPDDLSLERNAVEDTLQGVADHPSIIDEPDPDDVDLEPPSEPEDGQQGEDASGRDDKPSDDRRSKNGEQTADPTSAESQDDSPTDDATSDGLSETQDSSTNQPADLGEQPGDTGEQSSDSDNTPEEGTDSGSTAEVESSSDTASLASSTGSSSSSSGQSTFEDFLQDDAAPADEEASEGASSEATQSPGTPETGNSTDERDASSNSVEGDEAGDGRGQSDEIDFDPSETTGDSSVPMPSAKRGESAQEDPMATTIDSDTTAKSPGTQPDAQDTSETISGETGQEANPTSTPDSNDEGADSGPSQSEGEITGPEPSDDELSPEDFESDRQRAERTADELSVDEHALENELRALDQMLGERTETSPDEDGGGSGAGPGSVSELAVLPAPQDGSVVEGDWGDVEDGADRVANTLAKQLRLDQQTDVRTGLTSGTTVNRKTAHRLAYGDPRVFESAIPGDEKEYFIVIVLDRSGSMDPTRLGRQQSKGPSKIRVATSAVARFTVACENLGIDVAVVDFYDDTARLAKPASVDAEYAQETLLNTDAAGGTPLADALTLATSLADMDSRESIIITMTDGKPGDVDAVEEVIKKSYAPICSLTVATDCEKGNPPDKAEQLESRYDQTKTVYEAEALDDRLDEFASLLGAY